MTIQEALNIFKSGEDITPYYDDHEEAVGLAIEALEIADRLVRADAVDVHNRFCKKFHKECYFKDGCKDVGYKCEEAGAWENGYKQAIVDIRGDTNGTY